MELNTKLYDHQINAFEKLRKIKVGALYMEMGTGKTRTTLEFIKFRLEKGRINHVLWLCPCSVKETLRRDIIKHTGSDCKEIITICGIETLSSSINANVKLKKLVESKECFLIVDESNLVKNHRAKRTERIIDISNCCKYKMILNGTPISRSEVDLYAQWYILDWRILGYKSFWSFQANHLEYDDRIPGKIVRTLNTEYLISKIAPYTYQVKKDECLTLPKKTHSTEYYYLTDEQKEHYEYVADELLFKVDELAPHTIYKLFTGLQNVISGFEVDPEKEKLEKKDFFNNPLDNPRVDTLLYLVEQLEDNKVVIFCKYKKEITDLVEILSKKYGGNSVVRFDGEVKNKDRQLNISKFENESRFFIANKTCAGYGLNLQFCNYIIYYSNDWDYSTRSQSEDRVHRIGQDKNVHIIDICAANTLDERILNCLETKENLVESFKREIENVKDRKDLYSWIHKKDFYGKKYSKKIKDMNCENLIEENED